MGDIVLSGGEIGALMLLDACIRLLPGVMGATSSGDEESFEQGLLEYPHYTRPQNWEGRMIPEVLRSGDHAKIAAWRKQQAEESIHGYAGRTFGSVTTTLGSSLPLMRDGRIRIKWGMNLIQTLEAEAIAALSENKKIPAFRAGDTIKVGVKVIEGERTRIQNYEGVCIARSNKGMGSNFTVRKMSFGEGVERVFPLYSPNIDSIEVVRKGVVRRAKLYYLRGLTGKKARIAERRDPRPIKTTEAAE